MRKLTFISFFLYFVKSVAYTQFAVLTPSTLSVAQTFVADTKQWTAFSNPAMIGYGGVCEIGAQYENKYFVHELSCKSAQFLVPTSLINTGFSFSYFGYSPYHHTMFGLGFSRNFSDHFSIGLQANYFSFYSVASNTNYYAFFPQIGLSFKLSPLFSIGFHTFNPFQSVIHGENLDFPLPSVFSIGTEYDFRTDLCWRMQVDHELGTFYRIASGFDYGILKLLKVSAGLYVSDYLVPCLGFSFVNNRFFAGIHTELHPLLGLNTTASLRYRFLTHQ